jgi:hypothetical protein
VGEDLAGNSYTSAPLAVRLDNTAPAAPTVKLNTDTGVDGDGVTIFGDFTVSGLEKDGAWQYSSDGKTWTQGDFVYPDGTSRGRSQLAGEQTLLVRAVDKAGNYGDAVPLHFTLDNHQPAAGLKLDHIGPNGATGDSHTALAKADLVFSYTGTVSSTDTLKYSIDFGSWIKIDSSMIDTATKTITLHDIDLSAKDPYITIWGESLAGPLNSYQVTIDGPYTSYSTQYKGDGLQVMLHSPSAHLYLTDSGNAPVQLHSTNASGDLVPGQWVTVGVQSTVMQGLLGAGSDTETQTFNTQAKYVFGTTANDTLNGDNVWGFDGDDDITVIGKSTVSGGTGADTIHIGTASTQLLYAASAESSVVAGSGVAHGFDTIYLSQTTHGLFDGTLTFANTVLGDFYSRAGVQLDAGASGDELLAMMNTAVKNEFKPDVAGQVALISAGVDAGGIAVNFLAVDTDKDGVITGADYVVKIVGAIDSSWIYTSQGNGSFTFVAHTSVI